MNCCSDVFFPEKVLKICSRSNLIFRGLSLDFTSSFPLLKSRAKATIEQRKCKGHEKSDRFPVSKMDFNFQISQRNKKILTDPVLSNLFNFIDKCQP